MFTWKLIKGDFFHCWFSQWTKLKLYPFGLTKKKMKTQHPIHLFNSKWPFIKKKKSYPTQLTQNATSGHQICQAKERTLWHRRFQSRNIKTSRINGCLHVLSILPIAQQHSRAKVCINSARKVKRFQFISRATPVLQTPIGAVWPSVGAGADRLH